MLHYRIYLDVFFLINFIMDYIVLEMTAAFIEIRCSIIRKLFAAIFGGVWAVISICILMKNESLKFYLGFITYAVVSVIMILILTGLKNKKKVFKGTLVLYVVTFVLAGVCSAIWNYSGLGYGIISGLIRKEQMLLGIIMFFVVKCLIERLIEVRQKYKSNICNVQLTINKQQIQFNGLIDTGNVLKDPFTGKIVHVVRASVLNSILNGANDYTGLHYRLIPYNSVGNESGLMPVIDAECMKISECNKIIFEGTAVIGIYNGVLAANGMYDALINAGVLKN